MRVYSNDKNLKTAVKDEEIIEKPQQTTAGNIPDSNAKLANAKTLEDDPNIPDISIALLIDGKTDGQVTLVRNKGQVQVYEWKVSKKQWEIVGDMLSDERSVHNGLGNQSSKVYFEGKEYDYVFDVDLEGMRMSKLPYNQGDDVHKVAEAFLLKNGLHISDIYMNQIVEFIKNNVPPEMLKKKLEKQLYKSFKVNTDVMFSKISDDILKDSETLNKNHLTKIKEIIKILLNNPNIAKNNPFLLSEMSHFPMTEYLSKLDDLDSHSIVAYIDLLRILCLDISFTNEFIKESQLLKLWIRILSDECTYGEAVIILFLKAVMNMIVIEDSNNLCSLIHFFIEEPELLSFLRFQTFWEKEKIQSALSLFLYNISVIFFELKVTRQDNKEELLKILYNEVISIIYEGINNHLNLLKEETVEVLLRALENMKNCKFEILIAQVQTQEFEIKLKSLLEKIKENQRFYSIQTIAELTNKLLN